MERNQKIQKLPKAYKGKRLTELDMAKGLGIILVVIGHSTYVSEDVLTWLTSFHMPLFFVLSGMLFFHTKAAKSEWKGFLTKKFCQIMIPYFCFSIIYIMVDYYYLYAHPELMTQAQINYAFLQAVTLFGISVLWFLPTLFGSELLMYWIIRLCPVVGVVFLATAFFFLPDLGMEAIRKSIKMENGYAETALGYLFMALLRVFPATGFLIIGYYVQYWIQRLRVAFRTVEKRKKKVFNIHNAGAEILIGVFFLVLNGALAFANGRVDMHYLVFNSVLYFVLAASSASLGLVLILRHVPQIWIISFLGANSLIVMLTHLDCQVMSLAIRFAVGIKKYLPWGGDFLFYAALYGFILIIELILIYVINRYLFFLLGRSKPVKMIMPKFFRLKKWRFKIIK